MFLYVNFFPYKYKNIFYIEQKKNKHRTWFYYSINFHFQHISPFQYCLQWFVLKILHLSEGDSFIFTLSMRTLLLLPMKIDFIINTQDIFTLHSVPYYISCRTVVRWIDWKILIKLKGTKWTIFDQNVSISD